MSTVFGQIVIGPPGSGKTTYCEAMAEFLKKLGRHVAIVNLDPANENIPYKSDVDVGDLIQLEDAMELLKLGPNGALVYCMEFLETNFDWLLAAIKKFPKETYIIFDFPGQVELYTHHNSVKNIVKRLEKEANCRLCAVHLVDAHYCSDPSKFISVCLTSLNTMLQIELPHVNILSKADLIEKYGKLDFNIDFYTEVLDLTYLTERISDDPFTKKYKKLNEALTDLVMNYSLVNFIPLSVKKKEMMLTVKNAVDQANGYCFGSAEERNIRNMMSSAFANTDFEYAKTVDVRETFMGEEVADGSDEETPKKSRRDREPLGNDLDKVDIGPGFQV